MEKLEDKTANLSSEIKLILVFTFVNFLLHIFINFFSGYGIFRDELYYLACSNHLASGYVDQPPLSIFILAFVKAIFGDSVFAIRLVPAILSSLTIYFAGLITLNIGGKKVAIITACTTLFFVPVFQGMNLIFSMNSIDIFLWIIAYFFVIKILDKEKPKYWIIIGIIIGIGLLNKISFFWFGTGLFVGLLVTNHRVKLKSIFPYISAIIALLIFSPFIIWNFQNDFAHLEFISNASSLKYQTLNPLILIESIFKIMNPATAIIWLIGLYFFLLNDDGKKYRILVIIFLTTFFILVINWHSKAEYLTAAFPILFVGGGIMLEKINQENNWKWLKYVVLTFVVLVGLILLPMALPILPVETFISYTKSIGIGVQNSEAKETGQLPQFYSDMFGWEKMAETVSKVYHSLPEDEREHTIIFARNYGEAGAIDYYRNKYDLPQVISTHNNYWIWGFPEDKEIKTVIVMGGNRNDHKEACNYVEVAAVFNCKYCMPYEDNMIIYICKEFKVSLEDIWKRSKNFI